MRQSDGGLICSEQARVSRQPFKIELLILAGLVVRKLLIVRYKFTNELFRVLFFRNFRQRGERSRTKLTGVFYHFEYYTILDTIL